MDGTLYRMLRLISSFPRFGRAFATLSSMYRATYENVNYDSATNGELWLLETINRIRRLQTVFDVGANRGDWTEMLLEVSKHHATVHCFELCPQTYKKLAERFGSSSMVKLNDFGLADTNGAVELSYCPQADGLSSILEVVLPTKVELLWSRTIRGADYCVEHSIANIDFLKIDVEGAEHLVLEGFSHWIDPDNVPVIQFEYGRVNIATKFLLRDFYRFLKERGYEVGKLFPAGVRFREYRFEDEDFLGPNFVAASPELVVALRGNK